MDITGIVSVLVAVIAAAAAVLSQRSVAKASTENANTSSRVDMEKEAYDRARAYDTETIRRQDAEIAELREDNNRLTSEVKALRLRIARLEALLPQDIEEKLYERLKEHNDKQPTD